MEPDYKTEIWIRFNKAIEDIPRFRIGILIIHFSIFIMGGGIVKRIHDLDEWRKCGK
jgi:hypothetical protein